MKTEEAYHQYLINANNQANYESTVLWILFTLLVIAPIGVFIIMVFVRIAAAPKCPHCHSRNLKIASRTTQVDGSSIREFIRICNRCQTQF